MSNGGTQPLEVTPEAGTAVQVVYQGGCGCLELVENLRGGVSGGHDVRVGDVGDATVHWEGYRHISPQGGPQADGKTTLERTGQWMDVFPNRGSYGRVGITVGKNLPLPPPEHSQTVHFDQATYGTVSSGGKAAGVKGGKLVMGVGRFGLGGGADGRSGGGTDGGEGGDVQDGDRDGLTWWQDNVANAILGMEPNYHLDSDPGLETHHPIMNKLWEHSSSKFRSYS